MKPKHKPNLDDALRELVESVRIGTVSYTHLTLPTIYSV